MGWCLNRIEPGADHDRPDDRVGQPQHSLFVRFRTDGRYAAATGRLFGTWRTSEDYARLLSTNLTGFLHITQHAVRRMQARKAGHVVTVTTSLADQPIAGVPASIPILTKAGLNAITKALTIEYAADGIRFNTVAPGIVDTPMHKPEAHGFLKGLHPIARLGTTDEIVEAVLYLDRAGFVSGEVLHVDGGAHAGRW